MHSTVAAAALSVQSAATVFLFGIKGLRKAGPAQQSYGRSIFIGPALVLREYLAGTLVVLMPVGSRSSFVISRRSSELRR